MPAKKKKQKKKREGRHSLGGPNSDQILDAKLRRHRSTDYSQSPGVLRLGYTDPTPVISGREPLVRCLDEQGKPVLISMEEALGEHWFPSAAEIEERAAEARVLFADKQIKREPRPTHMDKESVRVHRSKASGIREIDIGRLLRGY